MSSTKLNNIKLYFNVKLTLQPNNILKYVSQLETRQRINDGVYNTIKATTIDRKEFGKVNIMI